jgi:hypothetical protein
MLDARRRLQNRFERRTCEALQKTPHYRSHRPSFPRDDERAVAGYSDT